MTKFGPRKTLYWPPEWDEVWEYVRIKAVREKTSVSKIVYDLLHKEVERERGRQRTKASS